MPYPHSKFVDRGSFLDEAAYSRSLAQAGGPSSSHGYRFHVEGASEHEQVMAAVYGLHPGDFGSALYEEDRLEQLRRPYCFVRKLRPRRGVRTGYDPMLSRPTFLSVDDFAEHYAAAHFAYRFGLWCDTSVTINWRLLGRMDELAAKKAFEAFLKCMRDWLTQRHVPIAFFFAHEAGDRDDLHTHVQVYVPGDDEVSVREKDRSFRRRFRKWAQTWARGQRGGDAPRAVRVSGHLKRSPFRHWLGFHYQLKGYDPDAVLVRAMNAHDQLDLRLGDLIAFPWRNPGVVKLRPRLGHSQSLGPGRRRIGSPEGISDDVADLANPAVRREIDPIGMSLILEPERRAELPWHAQPLAHRYSRDPFQSPFEAGHRDVRWLYPELFNRRVTYLTYREDDKIDTDLEALHRYCMNMSLD